MMWLKDKMMDMKSLGFLRNLLVLAMAAPLSACSIPFLNGYGAHGQSLEEFTQHVEEIFRLQNQMTSQAMMQLDTDEAKNPEELIQAEQRMQQACADLNEYVSRDLDGLESDLFLRQRVEQSAIDCEHAAKAVKPLLHQ